MAEYRRDHQPADSTARRFLPRGQTLPPAAWHARHVGILVLLWAHAAVVPGFALVRGYSLPHALLESAILPATAIVASWSALPRRARTAAASLGLLSSSAILVHLSGGLIEVHFHFFVMVTLVALYHDWIPFLSSIAYVFVHHGLLGALDPDSVFNHAAALNHPWRWAAIHAGFVLAISLVCLVTWRLTEQILDEHRASEARLLQESRIVQTLHDVGIVLATELNPEAVMQSVTDAATAVTGARFGGFFHNSADDSGEPFSLCTMSGAPMDAFDDFGLPRVADLFRRTITDASTIRLDDVHADPRYDGNLPHHRMPVERLPVRSYLAVPVRSRSGTVHGGLFFGHPEVGCFTEVHERLAAGMAAHASIALDNAILYERERAAALTLQQSLLPRSIPAVEGAHLAFAYRPADGHSEIGGDWYDVLALPGDTLALTVGDVVGHDLRAAAFMGQLRNVIRIAALEADGPSDALLRVDRYMVAAGLTDMTTVAQAHYNRDRRTFTFALAGHPPPLLIKADGTAWLLEADPLPPLGVGLTTQIDKCHDREVALDPGDIVMMYTDGLVERRDVPLDLRLSELVAAAAASRALPAEAFCACVLDKLLSGEPQADDVALLVLAVDAAEGDERNQEGTTAGDGLRGRPLVSATGELEKVASLDLRCLEGEPPPRRTGVTFDVVDSLTIIVGISRLVEEKWPELSDSDRKELATVLRRRADRLLMSLAEHSVVQL